MCSEVIRDVLAYMSLTLTGGQYRTDDESFARVLNKRPRCLPKAVLDLIKAQQSAMWEEASRHSHVGLEEAAKALLNNEKFLTKARRNGLRVEGFFRLVKNLRAAAISKPLDKLVLSIWEGTGLADWNEKKQSCKSKSWSQEARRNVVERGDSGVEGANPFLPEKVKTLLALAKLHGDNWDSHKEQASVGTTKVESLFDLAKKCSIERADEIPYPPQIYLPETLQDELHMPGGMGLPVVNSLLADLALQMTPDDGSEDQEADKLTISTIHRAKGLEWEEVYVPFFNEGFMPTMFREDGNSQIPSRHHLGCDIRARGVNTCQCATQYADIDSQQGGLTPTQRHEDEERRLSHVAATRAKNRLVFLSVRGIQYSYTQSPIRFEPSSFDACLGEQH